MDDEDPASTTEDTTADSLVRKIARVPLGLAIGSTIGKYRLEGLLGRGGIGEVWMARDLDLDRNVALKVLQFQNPDSRARLVREGRAMARLRHPNVVAVYEAASIDGRDLVAMELVDGETMTSWLTRDPPRSRIVEALLAAGRGLEAAHLAGVLHRDFKPHNVLVARDGRVLVTDFGLARAIGDVVTPAPDEAEHENAGWSTIRRSLGELDSPLTTPGMRLGTPAYMAPEQSRGSADERSDQFSFCVTVWEALAGRRPYPTLDNVTEATLAHRLGGEQLPRRVRAILERGLAFDPAARFPSMTELLRVLERAWRLPRRLAIVAASAAVVVALVVGVWIVLRGGGAGWCPAASDQLARIDTSSARAFIARARVEGGPRGARFAAFANRWRSKWSAAYEVTCSDPDKPDALARRGCLEALLHRYDVTTTAFAGVPTEALFRGDPQTRIPDPALCERKPRALFALPDEPARRQLLERLYARAVALRYAVIAGTAPDAATTAATLEREARATKDDGLLAAVLVELAYVAELRQEMQRSCSLREEAERRADQAGADQIRGEALLSSIACAQSLEARGATIERAAAIVERLGDPALRGHLLLVEAEHALEAGDLDRAIDLADRSRTAWVELDAPALAISRTRFQIELLRRRNAAGDAAAIQRIVEEARAKFADDPMLPSVSAVSAEQPR